ncbi:MAG: helix-turn-helix domain-containing protein, partial [Campylobacter sp.]|nr:helix-turn-helix domain-containing protein [Campylobacter sp.]
MKNHFIFNKELVKESIKKAGLTYAELAKIFADNNVNITEQSIKLWFIKNNANTPDIQKATILSRILNIPLNEILY